jgi:hypothetical protein
VEASTATIREYRAKLARRPSQSWRTFLQNHAGAIVAMDFFVVPTVTCRLLYVLVVMNHERQLRQLLESYWDYYHRVRPHRSLDRDSPIPRPVESPDRGKVIELPLVGGLHHHYLRQAA